MVRVEAFFGLLAARAALSTRSFARVLELQQRCLARLEGASSPDTLAPVEVDRAIRWSSRFVPRATCLTRALAGQRLLARRGVRTELCFGAGRDEDRRFAAHAWLERDGRVVLGDAPPAHYGRLRSGPPR